MEKEKKKRKREESEVVENGKENYSYEITFLGTSSAGPTKERNVSSTFIKLFQRRFSLLVDCGEGTQHQFLKSDAISPGSIRIILVTHLHGDHSFGLPGIICALSGFINDSEEVVRVVGPLGIARYLKTVLRTTKSLLNFKLEFLELIPPNFKGKLKKFENVKYLFVKDGFFRIGKFENIEISALEIDHRRIFCVGYVFKEDDYPGGFMPEKLYLKYGIQFGKLDDEFRNKHELPKFNYRDFFENNIFKVDKNFIDLIKHGKDVEYRKPDGKKGTILSKEVLSEPRTGKLLTILGDCINGDPNDVLVKNFRGKCDCLIHECTFSNEKASEEGFEEKGHSTPDIVAKFCNSFQPKRVIITHFSSRYYSTEEKNPNIFLLKKQCEEKLENKNVDVAMDFKQIKV